MNKDIETPFELRSWNRNMAFTPEELGILNGKCQQAVQTAIAIFDEDIAGMNLDAAQRAEALAIFSAKMSEGLDELVDTVEWACARRINY